MNSLIYNFNSKLILLNLFDNNESQNEFNYFLLLLIIFMIIFNVNRFL